jgi:hypothetical protein
MNWQTEDRVMQVSFGASNISANVIFFRCNARACFLLYIYTTYKRANIFFSRDTPLNVHRPISATGSAYLIKSNSQD